MGGNLVRVSAPGKILLSGEYAVLAGAPAVGLALNCRAQVQVDSAANLAVNCIGIGDDKDTRLLDCVRDALSLPDLDAALTLDTRAFSDTQGNKLGAGSSAALTVALCKALAPDLGKHELFSVALKAHRKLQGGRGSGADIATSLVGGAVRYYQDQLPQNLSWPAGLSMAVFWSGQSASTVKKLAQFESAAPHTALDALRDAAVSVADNCESAQPLLVALRDYGDALRQFDSAYQLGVFAAGHRELFAAARDYNVVYKPCGAGGGDLGIALADDLAALRRFERFAEQHKFRMLQHRIGPQGVRMEH